MLQSLVQGVTHLEVFSPQNADCLRNCTVAGTVARVFDKACKGYVLGLYNTGSVEIPKGARESLAILQPYLVVQAFIPHGKTFTVEIAFIDHSNTKRRLVFSQSREIVRNPLHVRLPSTLFKRDTWVNLCFDVVSFVQVCFPGQTYKHLDQVRVTAFSRIRRIFTMKLRLRDTTGDEEELTYYYDIVPPACDLPKFVKCLNQFVSAQKVVVEEPAKPLYYSNSPPRVNRKLYPGYQSHDSSIFVDKKHNKASRSLVPSPMAQYSKFRLSGQKLDYGKAAFPESSHKETKPVQVAEPLKLPPIGLKRLEPTNEKSEEYVEEELERQSPSPENMNRDLECLAGVKKMEGKQVSLPSFFLNTLKKSVEVRHFTPPFVNVTTDDHSLPRFRYDAKSRAYDAGLEEVKE